jgi:bifunctional non-homologous end joining protein LigD
MSLDDYRTKRQLNKTPEPAGRVSADGDGHSFVIQEHHARSWHFDLRLGKTGRLV